MSSKTLLFDLPARVDRNGKELVAATMLTESYLRFQIVDGGEEEIELPRIMNLWTRVTTNRFTGRQAGPKTIRFWVRGERNPSGFKPREASWEETFSRAWQEAVRRELRRRFDAQGRLPFETSLLHTDDWKRSTWDKAIRLPVIECQTELNENGLTFGGPNLRPAVRLDFEGMMYLKGESLIARSGPYKDAAVFGFQVTMLDGSKWDFQTLSWWLADKTLDYHRKWKEKSRLV